ncbi:MAG: hypothetical protein KJ023_08800 [Burkholderiaceae bacterium]|nr:hypothetical protein [Burkholderiaceae bacterium]
MKTRSLESLSKRHRLVSTWTFLAAASAVVAACGGSGGGDEPVPAGPNQTPTVTLDTPTAGANAPTSLALSASATDADGTIASVQFFNGSTLLGAGVFDAATSKYRLAYTVGATQHGDYAIIARATDNAGAEATSAAQTVTIAANVPPVVAVTSDSATLPENATTGPVTLIATASDSDGIAKVEFFNGAQKIGGDVTAAPYELAWADVAPGSYEITARATDLNGIVTTSAAQTLVVSPNTANLWANLSAAQKGGLALAPDSPIEDAAIDALQLMTAIGVTRINPSFNPAIVQGARLLADLTPAPGAAVACPGGGTVQATALPNGTRVHDYENCIVGGFTFYGGANMAPYSHLDQSVTPAVTRQISSSIEYDPATGRLSISGLKITGNGAPLPGAETYPRNAIPNTVVTCTGTGAARSCVTDMNSTHLWGNDIAWTGYGAGTRVSPDPLYATDDTFTVNGTYRPFSGAQPARNYRFEALTNTGGRVIVYGNNGYSVVTRQAPVSPGVERLTVRRWLQAPITVGGFTFPAGPSTQGPFECTVVGAGTAGQWQCVPVL